MKPKLTPLLENVAEATTACLFMMVQGNLLVLTLGHWLIASQTGVIGGVLAWIALHFGRSTNRWVVAVVLGLVTGIVDFFVHPGMLNAVALEAALTGLGAASLSILVGSVIRWLRSRRHAGAA